MSSAFIETHELCYHVSNQHEALEHKHSRLDILKNINLSIDRGSSIAVVGSSGSGKSSLIGMLAGLDTPSSGKIIIEKQDITKMNEEARALFRAKYVAFVFQNFQLLPNLNALENVSLPLEIRDDNNAEEKARYFLKEFGLEHRLQHLPNKLSGGEQQRVALARAFACDTPILFADEPTGNLDSKTGEKITELLFQQNKEKNKTLILVTHSKELASLCDEEYEMRAGQLRKRR